MTRNVRSIIFTFILAVILVYFFSIVGFMFLQDDFLIEVNPVYSAQHCEAPGHEDECLAVLDQETVKERSCDTLWMCIITTLNQVIFWIMSQPHYDSRITNFTYHIDRVFGMVEVLGTFSGLHQALSLSTP